MMSFEIINNVRRWGSEAQEIQESNNKIENLEQNLSLIDVGGEILCFDEMISGGLFFDELDGGDSCFDADWFMGCLDSDQENSKMMNLEETIGQNLSLIDVGGGNLCFDEMVSGGLWFDELDGGDSSFDGFDIDWFMGCLDSDQENRKKMNLEETIGENLSLIDSGAGNICFDELGRGDSFFDGFDIDWLMGYLDSDEEISKKMNIEGIGYGNYVEESRTSTAESFLVMDSGDADCSVSDQRKIGVFCSDDIDWLMRCLDSDKEEDLRCDDLDSFIAILDSEPVEHRTMSELGKRKFKAEEYSNQTKKKCLL